MLSWNIFIGNHWDTFYSIWLHVFKNLEETK